MCPNNTIALGDFNSITVSLYSNLYRLVVRSTRYPDIITMRINVNELDYPHFSNFILLAMVHLSLLCADVATPQPFVVTLFF